MAKKKQQPKQTLHMLRGLPASGKSTKARELVAANDTTARVNKDLLREMISYVDKGEKKRRDWNWERAVQDIEIEAARVLLDQGLSVVVDDTNLKDRHEEIWKKVAREFRAEFVVHDLLKEVSVEECARRDSERDVPVGRAVIYGMATYAGLIDSANEAVDLDRYIVCDLDGTLCDIEHRVHHIKDGKKDWDRFFDAMVYDKLNGHVKSLIVDSYAGTPCVFVTGRPESHRILCVQWLDYYEVPYHSILMRRTNDRRPDWVIKAELIEKYLNPAKIEMWIDDRASVIRTIRAHKIPVTDVGTRQEF